MSVQRGPSLPRQQTCKLAGHTVPLGSCHSLHKHNFFFFAWLILVYVLIEYTFTELGKIISIKYTSVYSNIHEVLIKKYVLRKSQYILFFPFLYYHYGKLLEQSEDKQVESKLNLFLRQNILDASKHPGVIKKGIASVIFQKIFST